MPCEVEEMSYGVEEMPLDFEKAASLFVVVRGGSWGKARLSGNKAHLCREMRWICVWM